MTERARGPVWSAVTAELDRLAHRADGHSVDVLDVGGGSGTLAVPLAVAGAAVTVVDTSADALATLQRRAREAGVLDRVRAVQGEADVLLDEPAPSFDLVLCHGVLEYVDEPEATLATVAAVARPHGTVSVLVAGRAAAVLTRALAGQFDAALALLTGVGGRRDEHDPLRRRYDLAALRAALADVGLVVRGAHGVNVFTDLDHDGGGGGADTAALAALESAASGLAPYRELGARLHVLAGRAAGAAVG